MTPNRFFKWVWRFNGIAIMAMAVVVIALGMFVGANLYREYSQRTVQNVVNTEGTRDETEELKFDQLFLIRGSSFELLPLISAQRYSQSYYEKSSYSTRNLLFVDTKSTASHWLFDTNDYLILGHHFVTEWNESNQSGPVKALLYVVVKADTNEDKRLTSSDSKIISISSSDGFKYKEVIVGADRLIGHHLDNNTLIILYQQHGIGYTAHIALSDFSVIRQSELPKVGNHL